MATVQTKLDRLDLNLIINEIGIRYPTKINKSVSELHLDGAIINFSYGGLLITCFKYENSWYTINGFNLVPISPEILKIVEKLDDNNYYLFMVNATELIIQPKLILLYAKQKKTHQLVNIELDIPIESKIYFSCVDELLLYLERVSDKNVLTKKLTIEGVMIQFPDDTYTILQTECYKKIYGMYPKTKNIHLGFLELYKKDKLSTFLPFYSNYSNDILHRINMAIKTLSREILNIYHVTRNKKNIDTYESLSDVYKKVLYDIHGLYISYKKKNNDDELDENSSINVHNVYYYIKELDMETTIKIFESRKIMLQNNLLDKYLDKLCIYLITQTKLMGF